MSCGRSLQGLYDVREIRNVVNSQVCLVSVDVRTSCFLNSLLIVTDYFGRVAGTKAVLSQRATQAQQY